MAGTGILLNDVAQAIQLALAPAFLLTAIAGLLNVMTGRLARIIDRGRCLTETDGLSARLPVHVRAELRQLDRRRYLASASITCCTLAALLLCLVITALFLEVYLRVPLAGVVILLFTCAVVTLVVGLGYFLREVLLATSSIRIAESQASEQGVPPRHKGPEGRLTAAQGGDRAQDEDRA